MMRAVLLVAIAVVSASDASAKKFKGAGAATCGEWLEYRKSDNLHQFQMRSWIDGYISGYNVANPFHSDFLASMPRSTDIHLWIDNNSRSKPLDSLAVATGALIKELQSR